MNNLKKIILSSILMLTVFFSLTSCSFIINNGERLETPEIYFDADREMVYWETVSGADKYYVKIVNDDAENIVHVYTSFYGVENLNIGVYKISVKAVSGRSEDTPSNYSDAISVNVTESGIQSSGTSADVTEKLINELTQTVIQANFTVKLKSTKVFMGSYVEKTSTSQGSGVIYKKDIYNNYYVLTNNHVIYRNTETYNTFEYTLIDCCGVEYRGELFSYNANYDLAVLKFNSTETYPVLNIASADASIGDKIITMSQPEGQKNAITFGRVQEYSSTPITVDPDVNKSNVTFNVLKHDAPIKSGSSGGAVINHNFEIVGINYASGTDNSGNFLSAYAIPVVRIKEYLNYVQIM